MKSHLIKMALLFSLMLSAVSLVMCDKYDEPNNPNNPNLDDGNVTITIVTTNDIHGQIENFPKLASLIAEKEKESDAVLVVSAGDYFTGNPYVDYAEERGEPMIRLLNKIGCDVVCYGNHEFDYGQEVLKKRNDEADFEIVCANMNSSASLIGAVNPYHIEEVEGLKICFLGLIETSNGNVQPATNPEHLDNITFTSFTETAPSYAYLADEVDAFIGLTHLGSYDDVDLTSLLPNLDLVIGGHNHVEVCEESLYNDVLITQTGSHLEYAGVATLKFEEGVLVERCYELVELEIRTTEDAEVRAMVEAIETESSFGQVVGTASATISGTENVACFMTDAMAEEVNADFAFYNAGGVRNTIIEQGDITFEDILTIEPFSNEIVTFELSLAELKEYVLRSYRQIERIDYYISKGKYEIYETGDGFDINIYDKDNRLLTNNSEMFTIAVNNYMAISDPELGEGVATGYLVTAAMVDFLGNNSPIFYDEQRAFVLE